MQKDRLIEISSFNVTIEHEVADKKIIIAWERGDCYFREEGVSYYEAFGEDINGNEYEAQWVEDSRSGGVFMGIEEIETVD